MEVLRSKEIRQETTIGALVGLVLSVIGFIIGFLPGIIILLTSLFFLWWHLHNERMRYCRIQQLSMGMDQLLHAGRSLPIEQFQEGELAILADQIQKITLRLMEYADVLQQDKGMLADALADISHQLRTPLPAMNLTAAMLGEPDLSTQRRIQLARELQTLLNRTETLVNTLLKLSRLDAGQVEMKQEHYFVKQIAAEATEPLSIAMELRDVTLHLNCGNTSLRCDLQWTAEAIGNILKNCMDHTPPGGSITLAAEETALYTLIRIEDTGCGFDKEDLPHLFERFYKGKNAAKESFGIGLSLAQKVIARQNGTIQAYNTRSGAGFSIKFYKQII